MDKPQEAAEPVIETGPPEQIEQNARSPEALQTLKEAYVETGALYRQFSSRRARLFAGYLVTVGGVALAYGWAWTHPIAKPMAWIVMAAGCLLTLVFWALERRSRRVSFTCIGVASELEKELGIRPEQGVYTRLRRLPNAEPTPGRTFDWMYLLAALALLIGTFYSLTETM